MHSVRCVASSRATAQPALKNKLKKKQQMLIMVLVCGEQGEASMLRAHHISGHMCMCAKQDNVDFL